MSILIERLPFDRARRSSAIPGHDCERVGALPLEPIEKRRRDPQGPRCPGALDVEVGEIGVTAFACIFVAALFAMRIYFARFYVIDKGRNPTWSVAAAIGFWGWVVL